VQDVGEPTSPHIIVTPAASVGTIGTISGRVTEPFSGVVPPQKAEI
jgi:hypothetical protein